jgi:hypothetical protein
VSVKGTADIQNGVKANVTTFKRKFPVRTKITIDGSILEQVYYSIYLGSDIETRKELK